MRSDVLVDRGPSARSIRTRGPLVGVRVLRALLWLVVFAGPVVAALGLVAVSDLADRVDASSRQTSAEVPADTGPVEGFAEMFLATYLTQGSEESPSQQSASDGGRVVVRTVSLGAEQIDVGYYAVTVAAVVRADNAVSLADAALEVGSLIYRVGVVETGSGLAVVGPPALIPHSVAGAAPDLLVGRMDGLDAVAGLEEATVRFLAAYLAGEGELARYTAPGSRLIPVSPAPFVSVEILEAGLVSIGDGTREEVVTVEGIDESGRTQVLQFGLVVGERDGRWEVVELLSAPSLAKGKQ
jgi:hypothetical protein